jgi:hypothetical protein
MKKLFIRIDLKKLKCLINNKTNHIHKNLLKFNEKKSETIKEEENKNNQNSETNFEKENLEVKNLSDLKKIFKKKEKKEKKSKNTKKTLDFDPKFSPSKAAIYSILINIGITVLVILIIRIGFDIKTVSELKEYLQKFRGKIKTSEDKSDLEKIKIIKEQFSKVKEYVLSPNNK